MTHMIEAKGLRKQIGDYTAVDGATFEKFINSLGDLALLAGITWFFVHWSSMRVEKAWPLIGT